MAHIHRQVRENDKSKKAGGMERNFLKVEELMKKHEAVAGQPLDEYPGGATASPTCVDEVKKGWNCSRMTSERANSEKKA